MTEARFLRITRIHDNSGQAYPMLVNSAHIITAVPANDPDHCYLTLVDAKDWIKVAISFDDLTVWLGS